MSERAQRGRAIVQALLLGALLIGPTGCSIERSAYYADKGSELAYQGRHPEALAAFEESIRLSPDWAAPRVEMGKSLWALGRFDEAVASYREAVRLDPEDDEARQLLDAAEAALARSRPEAGEGGTGTKGPTLQDATEQDAAADL